MNDLPRLLADFERPSGLIKADYTDFVVEEIPLYEAAGVGTHTYFLVEKAGLTTHQAVHDIARALNVARHDIGFAGLKDARAVTRQWMSLEHVDPERIAALSIPRIHIAETTRHGNKLRLGHLTGNHFNIKVRQTAPHRLAELQDALSELMRRGVPNYFGSQRFGYRGDTWAIGRAALRGEPEEALSYILGRPGPQDHGAIRRARNLYEREKYAEAGRAWPRPFHTERRALRMLEKSAGNHKRAFSAIDKTTRNFYVSAYQSHLFNQLLADRLPTGLDRLEDGDLAWRHESGAVFHVESAELEQARADNFEISPSGPLFGSRMTQPSGAPGEREARLLEVQGLPPEAFHGDRLHIKGGRRPLRFPPGDARVSLGADDLGPYLALQFVLPRGCYATALLRELFDFEQTAAQSPDEETEASD